MKNDGKKESGRWDLNPRPSAWQAKGLLLNHNFFNIGMENRTNPVSQPCHKIDLNPLKMQYQDLKLKTREKS